jgi:hypothetical protein
MPLSDTTRRRPGASIVTCTEVASASSAFSTSSSTACAIVGMVWRLRMTSTSLQLRRFSGIVAGFARVTS